MSLVRLMETRVFSDGKRDGVFPSGPDSNMMIDATIFSTRCDEKKRRFEDLPPFRCQMHLVLLTPGLFFTWSEKQVASLVLSPGQGLRLDSAPPPFHSVIRPTFPIDIFNHNRVALLLAVGFWLSPFLHVCRSTDLLPSSPPERTGSEFPPPVTDCFSLRLKGLPPSLLREFCSFFHERALFFSSIFRANFF